MSDTKELLTLDEHLRHRAANSLRVCVAIFRRLANEGRYPVELVGRGWEPELKLIDELASESAPASPPLANELCAVCHGRGRLSNVEGCGRCSGTGRVDRPQKSKTAAASLPPAPSEPRDVEADLAELFGFAVAEATMYVNNRPCLGPYIIRAGKPERIASPEENVLWKALIQTEQAAPSASPLPPNEDRFIHHADEGVEQVAPLPSSTEDRNELITLARKILNKRGNNATDAGDLAKATLAHLYDCEPCGCHAYPGPATHKPDCQNAKPEPSAAPSPTLPLGHIKCSSCGKSALGATWEEHGENCPNCGKPYTDDCETNLGAGACPHTWGDGEKAWGCVRLAGHEGEHHPFVRTTEWYEKALRAADREVEILNKQLEASPTAAEGERPRHVHGRNCWEDPGPAHGRPFMICEQMDAKETAEANAEPHWPKLWDLLRFAADRLTDHHGDEATEPWIVELRNVADTEEDKQLQRRLDAGDGEGRR